MKNMKQANGTKLVGRQAHSAVARMVKECFSEEVTFK